jgi:methylated-DNA-protein-cysteine methyltransferase-like protein
MKKKSTVSKAKAKKIAKETPRSTVKEYSFFQDVYDVARQVPKGRVTSYGAIAAYLGSKLSARMVGWAMNGAHSAKSKVPAQRVVNRNGMLTGKHHFATETQMEELLKKDGVEVKDDTVIDFENKFWDPVKELNL